MKRFSLILLVCIVICGFGMMLSKNKPTKESDLVLKNVEALASGEELPGVFECYFDGSVRCPFGDYAEYVIQIY